MNFPAAPQNMPLPDIKPGQLWECAARPGDEDSCILVNLVEDDPGLGQIFHIGVLNVQIANPLAPDGVTTELPHFPVSGQTLQESLTRLIGIREPDPAYEEGYRIWREAFDEGKAGIFTVPVAQIVEIVEQSIRGAE